LEAIYYDSSDYSLALQLFGDGTPTTTHTETIYASDADGIYRSFSTDKPVWRGGRYISEDEIYATDISGTLLTPKLQLIGQPALVESQTYSTDLTNPVWTATDVLVAKDETGVRGDENGACTLTATADGGTVIAAAITAAEGTHATAWHIKRKTGTGTIELTVDGGVTWQDITVQLDTSYVRIALDQALVTDPSIGIRAAVNGDAVIVGNAEAHLNTTKEQVINAGPIFTDDLVKSTDVLTPVFDVSNLDKGSFALSLQIRPDGAGLLLGDFLEYTGTEFKITDQGGNSLTLSGNVGEKNTVGFAVYQATGKMWLYVNEVEIEGTYSGELHDGTFDFGRLNTFPQGYWGMDIWHRCSFNDLKEKVRDALT